MSILDLEIVTMHLNASQGGHCALAAQSVSFGGPRSTPGPDLAEQGRDTRDVPFSQSTCGLHTILPGGNRRQHSYITAS